VAERLDKVLVDRGLAQSRERARALILAGKVRVKGQTVDKAGAQVKADDEITLVEEDHPYVSRGALKLVKGLDDHGLDPTGLVALDVGASTGGFTDVLLRRGARKVYAVDVGYGQLDWRLRNDPRVVVIERANIRDLDPARLDERPDLAVCDVSFISLTLCLPRMAELLGGAAGPLDAPGPSRPIIALIKPQFEVGRADVGKGGVVREPAARQRAIDKIVDFATRSGWRASAAVESPITGPAGNVEYLIRIDVPTQGVAGGS
jgi:23S rRNA (cytidine1920-2'-O)/16S rRNA (cytidine1409-2'-O)-methyltransferase